MLAVMIDLAIWRMHASYFHGGTSDEHICYIWHRLFDFPLWLCQDYNGKKQTEDIVSPPPNAQPDPPNATWVRGRDEGAGGVLEEFCVYIVLCNLMYIYIYIYINIYIYIYVFW